MPEPTITSRNISKPQASPSVVADEPKVVAAPQVASAKPAEKEISYRDEDIVPISMVAPDFVDLTPTSPHIALRWINFKVGPGQSTLRYEQCKVMGFINAKPSDIKNLPPTYVVEGDKIVNGDLILMKIDKARYLGILKKNRLEAERLGGKRERQSRGVSTVQSEVGNSGAPKELLAKVRPFIPTENDLSGIMGPDKQPTRR